MLELTVLLLDCREQRRDGEMRLTDVEADHVFLIAYGLHTRQCAPQIGLVSVGILIHLVAYLELDHVMTAQPVDEVDGGSFGDDLAVVNDGEAVAEALGFIHVVRGEKDGTALFLEGADDVPELTTALGIESGGGLVEKEDTRIADQCGGDGKALLLAAGKLANPSVGLLSQFEFLKNVGGWARFGVETGEELDGFAHSQLFGQARLLKGDANPLAQLTFVFVPSVAKNAHFSSGRGEQAFEDFDGRGLPCSVRTEESEALASVDLQAQAAYGFNFAIVGLAQVSALDWRAHVQIVA